MANIVRKGEGGLPQPGYSWDPFELMRDMLNWDPFRQIQARGGAPLSGFNPQFEVKETKDAYVFKADLPGIEEKDVEISLTGNRLTVSGKREAEKKEEDEQYYTYERNYGSFTRSFTLPDGIDADHVEAEMKNGELSLKVPKLPEHQPKKISVKSVTEKVKGMFGKDKPST